ncbi:MAG: AAA family ATPase [Cyclobacteriaceae bacterium]|nr:AAA family ATPase [Cyclobacteriaceae bacterium]
MNILIDYVRISGFRGLSNIELKLPRVTLLIGANNSGKTSVIKALQLALGDYSRFLTDEDFYIDESEKRQEKISIDVRIVSVDDTGLRTQEFSENWQQEFEDKIQSEAGGMQYVAVRTIVSPDKSKGGYLVERYYLEKWANFDNWKGEPVSKKRQISARFEAIPFIAIDAQRDIHSELKEKTSFIGKVLSRIKYKDEDVKNIEKMVAAINKESIDKSEPLKKLKEHLDNLNHSFEGTGKTELTPFPKKIRDLSKRFSVHFGNSEKNSFSMEYHGMGTRSWASMLTVKAFTELMAESHDKEAKSFFPILAAEEPEAHLHPNAQRTIYRQLIESSGQIIISTHSAYLAALAEINELRILCKDGLGVYQLRSLEDDDLRKVKREVLHSRGELLFSRAIVLSEGETEEQLLPELFRAYTGKNPFSVGVNFVGVGGSGAKYRPFLILSKDLSIPVFIFSDGEDKTLKELKDNYEKIFGETDINKAPNITILDGTDFEGYLLSVGFEKIIEEVITEINGENYIDNWIKKRQGTPLSPAKSDKPPCKECKQPIFESKLRDYGGLDGKHKAMLEILDTKKPMYAKAIADKLALVPEEPLPPKIIEFFDKIKKGCLI